MLGKRVTREVAENVDLQDPRDTAKARLLEIQSQQVLRRPAATATKSGDSPCRGFSRGPLQLMD